MATFVRAKETFFVALKTGQVKVRAGAIIESNSPLVKGREHMFEAMDAAAERDRGRDRHVARPVEDERDVEQATAAPGERRSTRRS